MGFVGSICDIFLTQRYSVSVTKAIQSMEAVIVAMHLRMSLFEVNVASMLLYVLK